LNNEYSALKHVTCNNGFKLIIRQPVDVNGVILLAGAGPQNLAGKWASLISLICIQHYYSLCRVSVQVRRVSFMVNGDTLNGA